MRRLVLLLASLAPALASAVPLEAIDPGAAYHVGSIVFEGTHALSARELQATMGTAERPWYLAWQLWKPLPIFDPLVLRSDLERIVQRYRNQGYYRAAATADVEPPAEGDAVRVVIHVSEGDPVHVAAVSVDLRGATIAEADRRRLLDDFPVEAGDVFEQAAYARGYDRLRAWYRNHGFARVQVERAATVDLERDAVDVRYTVDSGPPCVFGETRIVAAEGLDPDVVRREIAWRPGAPYDQELVARTEQDLTALRLYRTIRIDEDAGDDPRVDLAIQVTAGPTHEVRLGVGYDTEEEIRGIASWRDYDFFGGARQLGVSARASLLRRAIAAEFIQPHFPVLETRVRLIASLDQEDEETYLNDRVRLAPRIEWRVLDTLSLYAFYRIEHDSLFDVNADIRRELPDIAPRNSVLSGTSFGLEWTDTDDLLDPHRGWALRTAVEPVGGFLGGNVDFLRLVGEGRRYQPLPWRFVAAFRLRVGAADPFGDGDVPLFERFFAGGVDSVRGYERRHVGPFVGGDPIGGRTLVDGSIELRHGITETIGAAVFVDAGQVSVDTFDFPFDDLRVGTGVGARYLSPVGPLRLDIGFPLDHVHRGDARWQVYVSIGQTF